MPDPLLMVTISPPLRDIAGRFAKVEGATLELRREELRGLGRAYTEAAQDEAPKRTGDFARGIGYRTTEEGGTLVLNAFSPQPLGKWIILGTEAHPIAAKGGGVLSFFWPNGPKGPGQYFFREVQHPGTAPNPFNLRAWQRVQTEAQDTLRRMALHYKAFLTGETT